MIQMYYSTLVLETIFYIFASKNNTLNRLAAVCKKGPKTDPLQVPKFLDKLLDRRVKYRPRINLHRILRSSFKFKFSWH